MKLIDADALKDFINEGKVCDICDKKQPRCEYSCDFPDYVTPLLDKVIDSIPTICRPQGEWIDEDGSYYVNCSCCGYQIDTHYERGYLNFCPNCGADMRGKE